MSETQPTEGAEEHGSGCTALLLLLIIGAIGVALFFTFSGDGELARLPLTTNPTSQAFQIEEAGTVEVWVDIDVAHEGINPETPHSSLPKVVEYVVSLAREGEQPVVQRCNPFDSNFARTSGRTNPMGKPATRSYDGLVRSCGFAVEPGAYTVTGHVESVKEDPRIRFRKQQLVLRGPS